MSEYLDVNHQAAISIKFHYEVANIRTGGPEMPPQRPMQFPRDVVCSINIMSQRTGKPTPCYRYVNVTITRYHL